MKFSVQVSDDSMMNSAGFEALARAGITALSMKYALIESTPREVLREMAKAIAGSGLTVDTSHPNFGQYNQPYSLVNQYKQQRGRYLEEIKDGLDRLSIFGTRVVPLHTGGCCLPGAPEWALELCAESVRSLIPAAKDANIQLALENTFYAKPAQWDGGTREDALETSSYKNYDDIDKLVSLIDRSDSPYVTGCFDAGHAHFLGDLVKDHKKMMPRITLYHIHDNSKVKDSHLPPGYGNLDWPTLGRLIDANPAGQPPYIEAEPWDLGDYAGMIRRTEEILFPSA